jgi:hypothetical protein
MVSHAFGQIDLGGVRMAVIGTDLAWLPTGNSYVPLADLTQYLFHMACGIPFLLFLEMKNVHGVVLIICIAASSLSRLIEARGK